MTTKEFIIGTSIMSGLIPVLIGYKLRHILWYYTLLSLMVDLLQAVMYKFEAPIYWLGNIFLLGEWLLISRYIIANAIPLGNRNIAQIIATFVALFFIADTVKQSPLVTNLNGGAVLYMFSIISTIIGLYHVIQNIEYTQIERSPMFVFCAGFLLYFSGSLIMFLVKRRLDKANDPLIDNLWCVHDVLNVIKNVSVGYGLLLLKRKKLE